MEKYYQLADLLLELEMVMRQENLWDMPQPSPQDLDSKEPFCIDTMGFDQWLRFVMIERYKVMIEQKQVLPSHSNITPIADMFFKQQINRHPDRVLVVLKKFDQVINEPI